MELIRTLVGFRDILVESAKLLCIIRKPMVLFTIFLTPIICSLLYLPNLLVNKQTQAVLNNFEWIYFVLIAASWSFLASATILASAMAYATSCGNLSLKKLLLRTSRTWKRPLSTAVLASFLPSYLLSVNGSRLLDMLFDESRVILSIFDIVTIVLDLTIMMLCSYYLVFWIMGLVVSVLEGKSGREAIKEGREVVKRVEMERLIHGVLVNVVVFVVGVMVDVGLRVVKMKLRGLIVLICLWEMGLLGMVAYTILYMKCKEIHGEEVEVLVSMDCGKEVTQPLISGDIA